SLAAVAPPPRDRHRSPHRRGGTFLPGDRERARDRPDHEPRDDARHRRVAAWCVVNSRESGRHVDERPARARGTCPALVLAVILASALVPTPAPAQGQTTWAVHVSLAPTWFDPGEHTGNITVMMVLY